MAGVQAGRLNIEIVAEVARLQQDMDRIKRLVKSGSDDIAKSAKAANDNLEGMGRQITSTGNSSRLAGHHVQNLVYQFQDLGVQLTAAAGSSAPVKMAFMALIQQGSQIQGVMSQAGIGVKGLIVELMALLAPFAPIIAAAGAFAAVMALVTSDINENSKVHVTWMDTVLGAYDAVKAYLTGQLTSAFQAFGISTGDVWGKVVEWTKWAVNRIIGFISIVPRAILDTWQLIPAGVADIFLSAANAAIEGLNGLIRKSVDGVNSFIREANVVLDRFGLGVGALSAPQVAKLENNYAGAGAKLGRALAVSIADTVNRDFLGDLADKISPFAQARAVERMKKDAKKAGKDAGSAASKAAKDAFDWDKLVSHALFEQAADAAKQAAQSMDADWKAMLDDLRNADRLWTSEFMENRRKQAEEQAALNDQLLEMIGILGNMGGVGSVLGSVMGVLTGNTRSIGGPIGDLLNLGVGGTTTDRDGRVIAKTIGTELSEIFKLNGEFGKTMQSILQGAGTGATAASALFGKQSGTQQIGSAIGGVLGQEAGKALGNAIGGLAGKIGGPLGAIAGGVLGSVLGGMLTKAKWGRVDLSSSGVSGTVGNSGTSERAALTAGNSIFGALGDIASAFGGSVGDFGRISVGVRHGDYRVNAGGTSLKVKKGAVDFNDDAEAAIAYAIQLAIDRGAIQGIRASTNNLLKAGDDLQSSIQNALKFEGVFTELRSITDPMAYAVEAVTKEFDQLRAIFKEAGASAEEYASLEQLLAIKRQEAIDGAMQDLVDKYADQNALDVRILELMGRSEEALAAQRMEELAATSKALQPLQAMVYQLEDLTGVVDKFGPLADDLRAFKKELLGGDTLTSFASLAATFRSTAAGAAAGDATALGNLRGVSQEYLDAAMANAGSAVDYQRAMSEVLNAVDKGIFAADTQVDYAQAQIDALEKLYDQQAALSDKMEVYHKATAENSAQITRLWTRFEADGMPTRSVDGEPLQVEIVS
ncbi:hypothetical protein [Novosphingobium kaempferiae]|uniref:hypothetical protein n=1 Tax=Novosphingobium kaempferiae TaxID=2896849 RepID=UPI001E43DF72|nr:hypothetical protein [Novosphingobium kaempferiae]